MPFAMPQWELDLFLHINGQWRCALFDFLMPMISDSLFLWAAALIVVLYALLTRKGHWAVVFTLAMTIGASDLACSLIKSSVGRVRPYHSLVGTWYVDSGKWVQRSENAPTKERGSSFPSAHAANAMAAALVLYSTFQRKALWLIPLAIGYSRIYLGKHFPVDVLGGWLTGLGVACVLLSAYPILLSRTRSLWIKYRLRI
ncbi:MAG: phosphatase PAP2 family protein [Desulfomicrobium sp.]|nr:phosphatase PAP2 family protein [Desulfomicrobium sp.]